MTRRHMLNKQALKRTYLSMMRRGSSVREMAIPYWTEEMAVAIQDALFSLSPKIAWRSGANRYLSYESYLGRGEGGGKRDATKIGYIYLSKNHSLTHTMSDNGHEGNKEMPDGYTYVRNAWRRKND